MAVLECYLKALAQQELFVGLVDVLHSLDLSNFTVNVNEDSKKGYLMVMTFVMD